MPRRKKQKLPFDKRGGVIVLPRRVLESSNYQKLTPQSKVLITLLQLHWRNDKSVDYGVREAAKKIPCSEKTASKSFHQLEELGFVTCVEYALFNSRTQSRSRSWRLEWLPFENKPPNNLWEKMSN